jgi:uncharacterized protein YndB with AHSA1/START domain
MSAAKFRLTTDWSFAAPRAAVWQALCAVEDWPAWWRAVANVDRLANSDANGVGTWGEQGLAAKLGAS